MLAAGSIDELRRSLHGAVAVAGDPRYDDARQSFNALIDRHPRLVVQPLDNADVQVAFEFARAHALPVSVRGGGHSVAGHAVGQDALAIDLRALVAVVRRPEAASSSILFEPQHGAASRVSSGATAFGQRQARYNVSALGIWTDATDDARVIAWAREYAAALESSSVSGAGYLNYGATDEPLARVEAAFGTEKFARLRAVKRRYDPDNVLRFNHNIPPADVG